MVYKKLYSKLDTSILWAPPAKEAWEVFEQAELKPTFKNLLLIYCLAQLNCAGNFQFIQSLF